MRGCLSCRQRHLKCDKTDSQCLRCQAAGRRCVPAPSRVEGVSFRHGQNPSLRTKGPRRYGETDLTFPEDQVWVDIPSRVIFEDETARTAADYQVVSIDQVLARNTSSQSPTSLATSRPFSRDETSSYNMSLLPPATSLVDSQKLGHFNEAFLLRHFRKSLAPWLDVYNSDTHFSVDVVERAPSCPLLLYACLAISARHLSHTAGTVRPQVADGYHERCIEILLPVLENRGEISIDILLAATVILRFFEQISSHTPSSDLQRHLLAGSVYISSHVDCAVYGGLAEASFWVFVVQDIQFALAYRNPLRLAFRPFDEKLQPLWETNRTERSWTHKAIWVLAETITLCYGGTGSQVDPVDIDTLKTRIRTWEAGMPDSFRPLHFSPADLVSGRPFPVLWYTTPSQATATQHICTAKTLLLAHELNTPPGFEVEAIGRIQEEILENLTLLFGIALSTDAADDPAANILGCHALCACMPLPFLFLAYPLGPLTYQSMYPGSEWIRDPLHRTCLLEFLSRTEAATGWPWGYVIQKLGRDWSIGHGHGPG